jgi:flagellar hook-basal body complex protein FliE
MISGIPPAALPTSIELPSAQPNSAAGSGFQNILQSAIKQVDNAHAAADTAIQNFISGEDTELHSTVLATQKAELQFEMLMQVRNKVVSAYEEIMKMQV